MLAKLAALVDILNNHKVYLENNCRGCKIGAPRSHGMTGPWHNLRGQYSSMLRDVEQDCQNSDEDYKLLTALREVK